MIANYACLQVFPDAMMEAVQERILYAITAHMDKQGLISCGRDSAERTVALVRTPRGWTVFDDCADRLDMNALDGLGRCLTAKMRTRAVGVMCSGSGLMLRLYTDGCMKDTYITSRGAFGHGMKSGSWVKYHGHALRWRALIAKPYSVKELADAFARGEQGGRAVFSELRLMLSLDETADFGFQSIEEAGLQGVIVLYFRSSTRIKQKMLDHLLRPASRAATTLGAFFGNCFNSLVCHLKCRDSK